MKQFLFKGVIAAVAGLMLMASSATVAHAADLYLAVKAPPGFSLIFGVNGGSKSSRVDLFHTPGNGITRHNADGWYVQKLPAGFDVSQMKVWCVDVMEPSQYFGESVCSKWGTHRVPDDGIFKLMLNL